MNEMQTENGNGGWVVVSLANRAGSKPALNDIETAQAPGASRARWFGSSVSAARFQNHFPDAPPSASG